MTDREKSRERVRDICAGGTTWWWWYELLMGTQQVLPLWFWVDLGVVAMKSYFIFPMAPWLEHRSQMQFCVIHRIHIWWCWWGLPIWSGSVGIYYSLSQQSLALLEVWKIKLLLASPVGGIQCLHRDEDNISCHDYGEPNYYD